jgi:hypothetical protein
MHPVLAMIPGRERDSGAESMSGIETPEKRH